MSTSTGNSSKPSGIGPEYGVDPSSSDMGEEAVELAAPSSWGISSSVFRGVGLAGEESKRVNDFVFRTIPGGESVVELDFVESLLTAAFSGKE